MSDDDTETIIKREIAEAVKILREDGHAASLAGIKKAVSDLEARIPNKELTPEEKAAEYDRLMKEKNKPPEPEPPKPPPGPEPPEPKPEPPTPPAAKHWLFGDRT